MLFEQPVQPDSCLFLIFGATGDLASRKLMPAFYRLQHSNSLPKNFAIIAIGRKPYTSDSYAGEMKESVRKTLKSFDAKTWGALADRMYYYQKDFDVEESYSRMKEFIMTVDTKHSTQGNKIIYLATLPQHFANIINNMKHSEIVSKNAGNNKIIIEKPFGSDLKSAMKLNSQLKSLFREEQIYRIDHYLGKESVQNLFALRFANRIFEPIWSSEHIENIQITAAEQLGVEGRGSYYDAQGAVKDMVQNHMLQLLSIVTMEPPGNFSELELRKKKVELLKQVKIEETMYGQYNGYQSEKGVSNTSRTETYAAVRLTVENKRWKGTNFYLRTGKKLRRKASEVVIYFRSNNHFSEFEKRQNVLVVRIQPNEGIYLRFNVKTPGSAFKLEQASMDFCHECLFGINTPEAYEKLIGDVFRGDATLFTRWDELETSWKIIDPIAKRWHSSDEKPYVYNPGSWGPAEANLLPEKFGQHWREPM